MKGNVIQMNTLHLNSVRLNGIGKVQSVSLKGGSTEDPVFPPVEPPVEPTPTYTLSASVTNGMVSATRNGSAVNLPFTANEGDTIVVSVTPNDGYTFEGWNDGNTDNPRTITMTADVALSAQCVEVVAPPVGKYIQFEDKAVEAICVANWSSDGIGLTEEDAAAVTTIGTTFKGNTEITSFDELRYFTGVTTINANAFKGCTALRTISFEHITKVGNDASWNAGAFDGCTSLERAIMPKVTEIANYSFANCGSLAEAYMPNVTLIGSAAFRGTKIGGSHTLSYCKSIGASTFKGTDIEEIIAPSVTSIAGTWDGGAFADCRKLKNVRIGDATALGERTFRNCSSLETFIISATTPPSLNAALFSGTNSTFLIYVPDASLEAYKTAVNWSAYADRIHPLSEIEGSPYIQFADAEAERVLMANGVSSDGIGITKEDAAAVTTIGTWFRGNTAITSFEELKHFGITQLVEESFRNCTNLQIIALPQKATRIDGYSFNGCSALTTIKAEGVSYIGNVAFIGCSLEKANFPNLTETLKWRDAGVVSVVNLGKLTTLPYEMFCYCGKLKYCILPSSLTGSNGDAFYGAGSIEVIIAKSTTPPSFNGGDFVGVPDDTKIYVPTASVDSYKAADAWSSRSGNIFPISNLATDNPTLYAEIQQYL